MITNLTADNVEHGEQLRLERLQRVLDMINIKRVDGSITTAIVNLHDHTGRLSVNWASEPTENEINIIRLIWEIESEYEINNIIPDEVNI